MIRATEDRARPPGAGGNERTRGPEIEGRPRSRPNRRPIAHFGLSVTTRRASWVTDLLSEFSRLMQSKPMLDLLRAITGHAGVAFTDGHATAYGPGDFLTGHDDDVAGKNRLAAYVYGLTPHWRLEWGGLLLFHGHMDRTAAGLVPRFNTLDLFAVPQQHSVSQVTASASHRRFAVTGWLRGTGA